MVDRYNGLALLGLTLLGCGQPRMQSGDPSQTGLDPATSDGRLDDWIPAGSAGDDRVPELDGESCLDAPRDAILGIATRDSVLLAVRGGGKLEPLHTFEPSRYAIDALIAGEFIGAALVREDGMGEVVLLRNGRLIAQHTIAIGSWIDAALLGIDGTLVIHRDDHSLLIDGDGVRMLPPDVTALGVPDADGFVPCVHQGPGGDAPTAGFVHADGGDFRPLAGAPQYGEAKYWNGRFVYIGDNSQVVVEDPWGSDLVHEFAETGGALGLLQSSHWALVTRDDRPVLRVDLRNLEARVIDAASVAADATPTIELAGDFALGLAQTEVGFGMQPLWRLHLTTGEADLGPARWSHPTLERLDAQYCGSATQLLADGRLGVAARDAHFGYFQLEDGAAGGTYSTVGTPIEAPSLMGASQLGRWLVLRYDSGDNTYCPHQSYEPPPADAAPHQPPNGLQIIDTLGERPTLTFDHGEGRWYTSPSIAFDRDERCAVVYDGGRWALYDLADGAHVDLGDLVDVRLD